MAYLRIYLNDVLLEQRELGDRPLSIGRSADNDVVLPNAGVSSHHASIEPIGNRYQLIDHDSTNGTFVNQQRCQQRTLEYWDQIQIYNYVLKFMKLARLEEGAGPEDDRAATAADDRTMEIPVADVADLARLRSTPKQTYLSESTASGNQRRHDISKVSFSIGRDKRCELRLKGWFAPRLAATIKRQHNVYLLSPQRGVRIRLNGEPLQIDFRLKDGDRIEVRGRTFTFHQRADEQP